MFGNARWERNSLSPSGAVQVVIGQNSPCGSFRSPNPAPSTHTGGAVLCQPRHARLVLDNADLLLLSRCSTPPFVTDEIERPSSHSALTARGEARDGAGWKNDMNDWWCQREDFAGYFPNRSRERTVHSAAISWRSRTPPR